MTKRMLVDATHPEETRVAIVDDRRLEDFDFESASKKQLKGNIYLAKVVRIEPSLQAAFVEYGGNRHGFLPFGEIHPDYFRIPVGDRPHDEADADAEEEGDISGDISAEAYAEEVNAYRSELAETGDEPEEPDASERGDSPESPVPSAPAAAALAGEDLSPVATQDAPPLLVEPSVPTGEEPQVPSVAADSSVSAEGDAPLSQQAVIELGRAPDAELGLITDFGNAAVDSSYVPMPIESVGGPGEEDEIEERVRRPRLPRYKIQEVVKRRQVMLVQVVKEERGNKGAALTTFLSLAGRYCVLMPNTDRGGGVSRKITSHQDRKRMKDVLDQLETPEGMAVILRTAGMEQEPSEIQRDLEHLLRLWNNIREQTLLSTAPTLIYEEANLIKRSIRDLYGADVAEILVAGQKGYDLAHEFMRSIMPEAQDKIKLYEESVPLFFRYNVERQIDQLYTPVVQLRSGGYIVINPTEALVSIDVNSGRATRERHIEGTALKTNLEAADEIARQLRLRDLAGLVVIDFIDMEDGRNNAAVERRMKEAMKSDRARLQIGRLSAFGLMELSRQRLHPSLTEINFETCPHCGGSGMTRSVDSSAISILRQIEEEALRQPGGEIVLHVPTKVALYVLNQKRSTLHAIETRYGLQVFLHSDDSLIAPDCRLERAKTSGNGEAKSRAAAVDTDKVFADGAEDVVEESSSQERPETPPASRPEGDQRNGRRRGRFGRGRDRGRGGASSPAASYGDQQAEDPETNGNVVPSETFPDDNIGNVAGAESSGEGMDSTDTPRGDDRQDGARQGLRRRGRRGGRNRRTGGPRDNRSDARPEAGPDHRLDRAPAQQAASYASPIVPVSVHEIDTTPRDPRETGSFSPSASAGSQGQQKPSTFAPPRSPYEVTNSGADDGDTPKGGWWRRLTGQ